ncbi:replication initiation protein [Sinimarinibacterium sp. CAU 1509]|uniref:replication initiation protein n=1 Tax=Sinimarinibacterium sp. CAU 1509 TaxID=2562283 RepID=UPI0010AD02E4|nr:replication initiation protein [Sinimarinibacterium sp. CAU 1509]TJY57244.1 replication initiation protein [Sinimarinibacterium sp. CAU 1509]
MSRMPVPRKPSHARKPRRPQITPDSLVIRSNSLMRATWVVPPTVHTHRLLVAAIAAFDSTSDQPRVIRIEWSTLCAIFDAFGSMRLGRAKLKAECARLLTLQFITDGAGDAFSLENAIAKAEYDNGLLTVTFAEAAIPHLQALNDYTASRLRYMKDLESAYQYSLYNILAPVAHSGTVRLPLNELRASLGVQAEAYPEWQDFNRRVLKPAVEGVSRHSDLRVSALPLKLFGKAVSDVQFAVTRAVEAQDPLERAITAMLVARGVNETVAREKVYLYRPRHCMDRITLFDVRMAGGDIIKPGAYLATMLGAIELTLDDPEEMRKAALQTLVEVVFGMFALLPADTAALLKADFAKGLPGPQALTFEDFGPDYPSIRPLWFRYLRSRFASELVRLEG